MDYNIMLWIQWLFYQMQTQCNRV